jgi:hypothetical protein
VGTGVHQRTHRQVSTRRRHRHLRHSIIVVVAAVLLLVACDLWHGTRTTLNKDSNKSFRVTPTGTRPEVQADIEGIGGTQRPSRPVYRYSIIPGGVRGRSELRNRIDTDSLVSAHYRNFDVNRARALRLRHAVRGYVSYRRKGRVYWTTKRLLLAKGELVLTDGVHLARARCGNRVVTDRKLIPPEEFRRDPEEAAVITLLNEPEPPGIVDPTTPEAAFPPPLTFPPLLTSTEPPGGRFAPLPFIPVLPVNPGPGSNPPELTETTPLSPPVVPEPPTFILLLSGACGLATRAWRQGRSNVRNVPK